MIEKLGISAGAADAAITLSLTVTGATATQSWRADDVEFSTSASVAVDPALDGVVYSVVVVPTKNGILGVSATASDVTFTYQWQYRDDDIGAWNSIGGATSATYTLADFVDERRYQCVVTGTNNRTAGTDRVIQTYTASSTWTKPVASNFKELWALVVSGAGGAGSGRRDATTGGRSGGGGGNGGLVIYRRYLASELASGDHTVTVGTGGTGGAGQTTNATNGNVGIIGGTSSFSTGATLISITGGSPGGGGTTTTGAAGAIANPTVSPADYIGIIVGRYQAGTGDDGTGNTNGVAGNTAASGLTVAGASGAGGGGCNTGNTESVGKAGGGIYSYTTLTAGPTGAIAKAAGTAGTNDIGVKIFGDNAFAIGFGTGGAGAGGDNGVGGSGTANNAGGNGGRAAGGGGGGGNTNDMGNGTFGGGNGGDGFVILIEYYGAA